MWVFVCVRCCAQHVKIDCMYTFCQSTLICGVQLQSGRCNYVYYCKHRGGVLHQRTEMCRAVLVQYIWSSFPTTMSPFNCFFYEIVISILHIKFPSILPQYELLMDNDKSDNETSNWNQFNWWIFTAFCTPCTPLALPLSDTTGKSSTDWGGEDESNFLFNIVYTDTHHWHYYMWKSHYERNVHSAYTHTHHTFPSQYPQSLPYQKTQLI